MKLPEQFIKKYERLLGEEAQAFFQTFEEKPVAAFRVNPLKTSLPNFSNPIPNSPWSYYGKISGKSIEHVTGAVYSQEPSAQIVGQVAAPQKGIKVLDLAASPGGKATHLLTYLDGTGILVANEINKKRSKVLVENLERFGARNTVVTNETPERLAKVFPSYFDLIVLDAPCSGEGMFRKNPEAIAYWSESYPIECANRQREILAEAMKMLAPGGQLVYSTCTWSPEENEAIVNWLLENYTNLALVPIPKSEGMVGGIDQMESIRLYPHHFKGEGQFVAKLQDSRPSEPFKKVKLRKSQLSKEKLAYWQTFSEQHLNISLKGVLHCFGDELYLLPDGLPDLSSLRIARNGLHLGTFKKKRFEPSFALGMAMQPDEVKKVVAIDSANFKNYVAGESLILSKPYPNGWYQLTIEDKGLGFVKIIGNTLKNKYPKGLRFK